MTTTPQLLRKNLHSVYTLCNECHTWGVNYPGSKECGNCGSFDTMVYYDEETVAQALQDQRLLDQNKTKRAYCEVCHVFIDADTGERKGKTL